MTCLTKDQCDTILASVQDYKSRRMKILEALRQTLETIKYDNGYCHTLQCASFDVNGWQDNTTETTPIIYIVDDKVNRIERMAGKQRQYYWKVLLFGVCKGMSIEEFEDHIADVQTCIEDNGWLCGLASQTEVDTIQTDNQLFSEKENTHLWEMAIEIRYIQCHGDPR